MTPLIFASVSAPCHLVFVARNVGKISLFSYPVPTKDFNTLRVINCIDDYHKLEIAKIYLCTSEIIEVEKQLRRVREDDIRREKSQLKRKDIL